MASAALLSAYLLEIQHAESFEPQLQAALGATRQRSHSNPAVASTLRALEKEAMRWTAVCHTSQVWRPLVIKALRRCREEKAAAVRAAVVQYDQAVIGLATLRACFATLQTLSSTGSSVQRAHASLSALCGTLLDLVFAVLAGLRSTEAHGILDLSSPATLPRRSAEAIVEQDAEALALGVLGCSGVVASLRRQPLAGLLGAASAAELSLHLRPATVNAVLLASATRAACADAASPLSERLLHLALTSASAAWDACCTELAAVIEGGTVAAAPERSYESALAAGTDGDACDGDGGGGDDDDDAEGGDDATSGEVAADDSPEVASAIADLRRAQAALARLQRRNPSVGKGSSMRASKDGGPGEGLSGGQCGGGGQGGGEGSGGCFARCLGGGNGAAVAGGGGEQRAAEEERGSDGEAEAGADAIASSERAALLASLRILRWWRPLALGLPSAPRWALRARQCAVEEGDTEGDRSGRLERAAALCVQACWRARLARHAAASRALSLGGAAGEGEGDQPPPLRSEVLRVRATLLRDTDAGASVRALVRAIDPSTVVEGLQSSQRHLSLQLAALALVISGPSHSVAPSAHGAWGPRVPLEHGERGEHDTAAVDWAVTEHGPLADRVVDQGDGLVAANPSIDAGLPPTLTEPSSGAARRPSPARIAAAHRLCASRAAAFAAAHEAVSAATVPALAPSPTTMRVVEGGAAFDDLPIASTLAVGQLPSATPRGPPSITPLPSTTPPPAAFAAAHAAMANGHSCETRARATRASPCMSPASKAREAAEESVAAAERAVRAATHGGGPAAVVASWWLTHFGSSVGESVPFERMRVAAEAELGPLSSVDVQLLRLELADERGKLQKVALTRLLSGSVDGTTGHASVQIALRLLLHTAREQLDRQVEVRMRQASSRSTAKKPVAARRGLAPSPVERRVRLEFDERETPLRV